MLELHRGMHSDTKSLSIIVFAWQTKSNEVTQSLMPFDSFNHGTGLQPIKDNLMSHSLTINIIVTPYGHVVGLHIKCDCESSSLITFACFRSSWRCVHYKHQTRRASCPSHIDTTLLHITHGGSLPWRPPPCLHRKVVKRPQVLRLMITIALMGV
jgi:hypothetical protein